jgi:hypothetical protein
MANRRFIDFPIASTVGDNDIILIWQSGLNKQTTKATFLSGLPENLDELNDVAISGLTNGQILRYDSVTGKWENTDQGNLDLNDLNDVSIVSPSNGQVLVYNSSTSKWENSSGGYVPYTGAVTTVNLGAQTIQAGSFVKAGGTAAQFLKANGSVDSTAYGTGSVTSVALTMPTAFIVNGSPITTAGTLAVTGAGTVGQYIRGDGSLADFPESSGGGSSVSYYLNGSVAQGTIGGVAYKELNKVPVLGAGTDFTIAADGYIASFITDAGDPNLLEIPAGNWNFETYFSASSSGGTPSFYVELYKYNGTTFTLIASSSSAPEFIAFGTITTPYFSSLAVPTTALALTDRLAVRYYVTHSGRTITLHTENNHLCQIVTTFTTGLTALNGLTAQIQNFAVGTSGTDFNIASATSTHTFNLPTASATNRGALSSADWTTFNNKQNALTNPVTGTGTTNYLPKFTGASTIGNSIVSESGGIVSVAGRFSASGNDFHSLIVSEGSAQLKLERTTTSTGLMYLGADNVGFKVFDSGFATRLTLTPSGNLGLGVTPSAWRNIFNAFQVGYTGALYAIATGTAVEQVNLASNYFQDSAGNELRIQSGFATRYQQASGEHRWSTAASSSANSGISFTQAMTLGTNSGLSIGTPSAAPSQGLLVQGNVGIGASPYTKLDVAGSLSINGRPILDNSSAELYIGGITGVSGRGTDVVALYTANTERMRITSGGNVGIGTTSPNYLLHIAAGAANPQLQFTSTGTGSTTSDGFHIGVNNSTLNAFLLQKENASLQFLTNDTERMRLDASGNLGLGVTPSAWGDFKVLEFPNGVYVGTYTSGGQTMYLGANNYFDGSNYIYKVSGYATRYQQVSGAHQWHISTLSGTAGNVASFTQAMTLFSSGNLLVGTGSDNGARLQVSGSGVFTSFLRAEFLTGENNNSSSAVIQGWNKATTGDNKFVEFYTEGGSGTLRGSIDFNRGAGLVRYNTSSDYRLKTEIEDFNANAIIQNLKPKKYRMIDAKEKIIGFIAHELQEFYPQAVSGKKDQVNESGLPIYQGIDYSQLTGLLVKAIQELKQEIDTLKN